MGYELEGEKGGVGSGGGLAGRDGGEKKAGEKKAERRGYEPNKKPKEKNVVVGSVNDERESSVSDDEKENSSEGEEKETATANREKEEGELERRRMAKMRILYILEGGLVETGEMMKGLSEE